MGSVYISLRDRPGEGDQRRAQRSKVPPVVLTLGFVSLLTDVSSESVSAILPIYLTAVLGLSTIAYGVVDGLYQGVSALVRVAAGIVADSGRHPKWVAFAGYGLSAVSRGFLLVASGFGSVAAVVTADRIGKGVRTAPRDAMISAAADPQHVARAFGVHRTLDTVGAAAGPLLAFFLLWLVPDGYTTVMVVSLAFALVGLALLGLLVPDMDTGGRTHAGPGVDRPGGFQWRDLRNRRLARLLVVSGVLALFTVGDGFVYLALLERGDFGARWFPLMYVVTNLAYMAFALPLGRLADRVGRARVLVLGHLALLGAYLCAATPGEGSAPTVAALLTLGVFYAATDGVIAALAGQLVPASARATGIAAAQTVVVVGRLFASMGFGSLWYFAGPRPALLVVAGALLVATVVGLFVVRDLDRRREVW